MSDPFFTYFKAGFNSVSRSLYGPQSEPKSYDRYGYRELEQGEDHPGLESATSFKTDALPLSKLAALLEPLRVQSDGACRYISPSGCYPLEHYVLVRNVDGLETGFYHYSATKHALAKLPVTLPIDEVVRGEFFDRGDREVFMREDREEYQGELPPMVLLHTLVKERIIQKYGTQLYQLGLLEAGAASQTVHTVATEHDCVVRPLDAFPDCFVHELLQLDGINEHFVFAQAIGEKI